MRICIPTNEDNGLSSTVCAHFGSAPWYVIVDSEAGDCRAIANGNPHHAHGMCTPLQSLRGEPIDAVVVGAGNDERVERGRGGFQVVGGIGGGALAKLSAAGVEVYRANAPTVAQLVHAWKTGGLQRVDPATACAGHGHDHDHGR